MHAHLPLACGLTVVVAAATASADPLRWSGPEGCGDDVDLAGRVAEQRGAPLGDDADVAAEVEVERRDDGTFTATLTISVAGVTATRALHARDCVALAEAAALVIAMAAPVAAASTEPRPVPTPVVSQAPTPAVATEAPPPPEVHGAHPPPELRLRVASHVGTGPAPGANLGGLIAVAVAWRPFVVELGAEGTAEARTTIPDASGAGADVGLWAGRIVGCAERGSMAGCAGVAAGRLRGTGVGVGAARAASLPWWAASGAARWRRPLTTGILLAVELEGQVALQRPRFTLDDGTLLFEPAAVAIRLAVGLEVPLR